MCVTTINTTQVQSALSLSIHIDSTTESVDCAQLKMLKHEGEVEMKKTNNDEVNLQRPREKERNTSTLVESIIEERKRDNLVKAY